MPAPTYDDGSQAGPSAGLGGNSNTTDGHALSNAAAGNGTPFQVTGGMYAAMVVATGAGTVDLQILGPDGSTWIAAMTQITTSPKYQTAQLQPGKYRWATAGFTAIYATIARIPQA